MIISNALFIVGFATLNVTEPLLIINYTCVYLLVHVNMAAMRKGLQHF